MHRLHHIIIIIAAMLLILPSTAKADKKDNKFIVCLDAGHGGKDPGAVGSKSTNREKDINLAIVKEVKRLLSVNCSDVKIVCTRETDVFIELGRRAEIANNAKANLFISVHVNAIPRTARKARGVQSYTLTLRTAGTNLEVEKRENSVISLEKDGKYKEMYYNSNSPESQIMLELMQQKDMEESVYFAKLTQREMVQTGGRSDMGVLQANLAVLRLTYMPSVLLEVGYISTEDEEQFLMTTEGRNIMARSIYNAIIQYKAKVTGRQSTLVTVTPEERKQAEAASKTSETTTKTNTKTDNKGAKETTTTPATTVADSNKPVFKLQILAGSFDLKPNDRQFKGHQAEKMKDGKIYKYFIGSTTDYNEIRKQKDDLKDTFPGCYVVAFKNGQLMNVNEAISEWKKNK